MTYEQKLAAAIAAYNEALRAAGTIDAHNVEEVRRRAMIEALRAAEPNDDLSTLFAGMIKGRFGQIPFGYRLDGDQIVEEPWRQRVVDRIMTLHHGGVTIRETVRLISEEFGEISFSSVQRTIKRQSSR